MAPLAAPEGLAAYAPSSKPSAQVMVVAAMLVSLWRFIPQMGRHCERSGPGLETPPAGADWRPCEIGSDVSLFSI